jgi:hypothetical protein
MQWNKARTAAFFTADYRRQARARQLNLRDVPVSDCRHPISPLIVFFGPKPSSLFGGFRQSFVRQRFCSAFVLDQVAQPLMSVAKMPASVE